MSQEKKLNTVSQVLYLVIVIKHFPHIVIFMNLLQFVQKSHNFK